MKYEKEINAVLAGNPSYAGTMDILRIMNEKTIPDMIEEGEFDQNAKDFANIIDEVARRLYEKKVTCMAPVSPSFWQTYMSPLDKTKLLRDSW